MFNVEIYVFFLKDVIGREEVNLYFLICGSYLYIFILFLYVRSKREGRCILFEISFEDKIC